MRTARERDYGSWRPPRRCILEIVGLCCGAPPMERFPATAALRETPRERQTNVPLSIPAHKAARISHIPLYVYMGNVYTWSRGMPAVCWEGGGHKYFTRVTGGAAVWPKGIHTRFSRASVYAEERMQCIAFPRALRDTRVRSISVQRASASSSSSSVYNM